MLDYPHAYHLQHRNSPEIKVKLDDDERDYFGHVGHLPHLGPHHYNLESSIKPGTGFVAPPDPVIGLDITEATELTTSTFQTMRPITAFIM
ncbi:hypothetical protein B0A48_06298 [Cryoendolithus antarcticus]|uniref:Uncharacterized protein n=1 Tax=Cryoendolithus antarcticus TaxID=1507870 RepID=A0A1V8TB15_9PEZI|nr:hypothetical protein B0A48_06298 [Cryoendolithus antarcticus]